MPTVSGCLAVPNGIRASFWYSLEQTDETFFWGSVYDGTVGAGGFGSVYDPTVGRHLIAAEALA